LAGEVLVDIHDEWVSVERRYFSEGAMAKLYVERDNDDAAVGELVPADRSPPRIARSTPTSQQDAASLRSKIGCRSVLHLRYPGD
jgi:hypothetical protein